MAGEQHRRRATMGLVLAQARFENRRFWRSPLPAFFTMAFPLMFLVLFVVLFGDGGTIDIEGRGTFSIAQFFAPALAVFATASATYTNIGIGTAIARDEGVLKRFLGSPQPSWIYLAGRVVSGIWLAGIAVALMLTVGVVFFDVIVEPARLPAVLVTFVVGAGAFAALGLMLAALAPSGESSPAIANATILPLAFVSDIFIFTTDPPRWFQVVGDVFPLKHFVRAFQDAFHPGVVDAGIRWGHLAVVAAWGIGAALIARRTFRWDPKDRRSRAQGARSSRG